MNYIDIRDLSYKYPNCEKLALNNINIEINKGEIILILGSSGSGKSTLAKCITGSVPNFYGGSIKGDIHIEGALINQISQRKRASEITMVFQDPEKQLIMDKVHREIAFGLENIACNEEQIKRRVWESLQYLNISDLGYREINSLSGGQKQKVAIASAIAYMPNCIIMDEPTSQLDPTSSEEIINIIKKINEELGITIIIIEQRIGKWFEIADNIALMDKGEVIFYGDKEELYHKRDKYSTSFLPSYLKICNSLMIEQMPKGLKEARGVLSRFDYNYTNKLSLAYSEKNIIEVKNITCSYAEQKAIKNLSINIKEGDLLGVLGANGAGKSTFLKAIMGLVKYSGSIKLLEEEVKKLKLKEIAKFIGYISQNPNDYISKETVYDELKFTMNNFNIDDESVIEETLKNLGIYHLRDINPRDTSGGERQRIAIASMLVLSPKILLLDEPTRGLDYDAKRELGNILKKLKQKGTTIIMVTHDVEFAAQCCNSFMLMFNGEKVSEGNSKKVLGNGLYFTTTINRLLRDVNSDIFTLEQALYREGKHEKA